LNQHFVSIIDDEGDLVYLFKEALKQIKDIHVFGFTDPKLALEHFMSNQARYQVVISDYRMPTITGLELLRKIGSVNPAVKKILISAFEIQDDLFRDRNCVDRFLQKPIPIDDLINEVETHVTKPNLDQSPN
jgi:DNA-binding NtrC family response regulator